MVGLSSEIIVGIDFGTTYSGVSWAVNEGLKKIRLITDWPNLGEAIANQDKVPSTISYNNGQVANWGYEVTFRDESFKWIKILLEPNSKYATTVQEVRDSNELLRRLGKTAEEVVRDYLREIWRYTKEDIRKRVGDNDWENNFSIHIVFTVPAMWSHLAKDKTLKVARAAGLPGNIKLVTEPEAAALATLHDKAEENSLAPGDTFVVCDAGGGTVDLISYKVNRVKPLGIEECAIGDGGLCGSIFLDTSFEKHICTLVGEREYSRIRPLDKRRMMKMFELGVKRSFTLESNKDYSVELIGVEDNPDEGIVEDMINLETSMLRTVFDYVCGQIDTLIQRQVNQVQDKGSTVKAILLVGGFGASKYLHKRIENSYSSLGIRVLQVDGAWSAICRGACLWGLEHTQNLGSITRAELKPTLSSWLARYSLGVSASVPFDPARHLWQDRILHRAKNKYYASDQMIWLLRRGETVTQDRVLHTKLVNSVHGVGFTSSGTRQFSHELLYSDESEPPSRQNEKVKQLCSVEFGVPETKIWKEKSYTSGAVAGKWRDMVFDLSVNLGNTSLDFVVAHKSEPLGSVEATYLQHS
ncbi:hypothetical protein B0T10DRAFT_545558 [Thelonectria olida]|uniref:Actin-like ATPase domain-containing protein n=1 Tax=Thelonectria olida TaxID=1576542 RepID=A0A9P8WF43_9HYPO|nr:hypothetical protein B0T10DRAFT_545558 [Thelonectria olida]